jgi:hypothetical protein
MECFLYTVHTVVIQGMKVLSWYARQVFVGDRASQILKQLLFSRV